MSRLWSMGWYLLFVASPYHSDMDNGPIHMAFPTDGMTCIVVKWFVENFLLLYIIMTYSTDARACTHILILRLIQLHWTMGLGSSSSGSWQKDLFDCFSDVTFCELNNVRTYIPWSVLSTCWLYSHFSYYNATHLVRTLTSHTTYTSLRP